MRVRFLALVVAAAMLAGPAFAAGIDELQAFVSGTRSARATFAQTTTDKAGRVVQKSTGTFAFARPGRFRWTYDKPLDQLIVGDGERVWIYDKDLNQVTVRKLSRALGSTPAALLAGSTEVEKAFELSEGGMRDGLEWLEAKPREREAGFDRVRMGFGSAGVEAMELVDHFGQTTLLRFTNLARNPKVDPAEFQFTPPKGADVLGEK